MSGPDDLDALSAIPDAPPSFPVPIVAAGHAQEALSAELDELTRAYLRLEALAVGIARGLDAMASKEAP
jgi:hypothetical protein